MAVAGAASGPKVSLVAGATLVETPRDDSAEVKADEVVEGFAAGAVEVYPVDMAAVVGLAGASPVDTRSVLSYSDKHCSWACLHCT